MPNKVRHLRGTDDEWRENDVIIDDGEIALALSPCGNYRMKIGTGNKRFSELDMFGVDCNGVRFTFKNTRLFDNESAKRCAVISEISFRDISRIS